MITLGSELTTRLAHSGTTIDTKVCNVNLPVDLQLHHVLRVCNTKHGICELLVFLLHRNSALRHLFYDKYWEEQFLSTRLTG